MLGGLFSNKSTAAVFVDYEHWSYGYKNIFSMRPNVEEWYKELKEEYNVKSITFFGDFHGSSIERDLERLEKLSKNVVHTASTKDGVDKDFTDFIILDAIYREAAKKNSPEVFIIFTGDAHFNLAIKYLRELKKKVIVYGVKHSLSNKLKASANSYVEMPRSNQERKYYYDAILQSLYILKKRENIMPKGSEQLTNARKEEIINACAKLYTTMNFKDITLKQISLETTFTRTSIYNYFQTKEEIFLALFQREYDLWTADIRQIFEKYEAMTVDEFASALAHTLEKRECLLKLLSMNHYDMESRSRLDNLVEFKKSYGNSMAAVTHCLEKFFPKMTIHDIQDFLYVFFPFLFGIYPYTYVTEKQTEAMEEAHTEYVLLSLYEITYSCIKKLLADAE